MNFIYSIFSSVKTGIFFIATYALATALATFIENDYGTPSANWFIYRSTWFNILNFLMVINMLTVFVKYKIYQIKKLTTFTFHTGFVIIIIGAGVTRFFSYEGVMHIREGETSNTIVGYPTYLFVNIDDNKEKYSHQIPVNFSELSGAKLSKDIFFKTQKFNIEVEQFIPNAAQRIVENETGSPIIEVTYTDGTERDDFDLLLGETHFAKDKAFGFNDGTIANQSVQFIKTDSGYVVTSDRAYILRNMTDTITQTIEAYSVAKLEPRKLYDWGLSRMVVSNIYPKAVREILSSKNKSQYPIDAIKLKLSDGKENQALVVFGKETNIGTPTRIELDGKNIEISYGSLPLQLPFSLSLTNFNLDRYPGSMSPSSYESFLTLNDPRNQRNSEEHIFMNNVLEYDGIRFYQSSYDADEQGTILSVNQDYWGTLITYLGYFLMSLGMFLNIFSKNSRFAFLNRQAKKLSTSTLSLLIFSLILNSAYAQSPVQNIDANHAKAFGKLLVQDHGGRIKPINTLSNELLRKVSRISTYNEMNADQVILGMILNPQLWSQEPIIKIKNPDLIKLLKVKNQHIALSDLFDQNNQYIISKEVNTAYNKAPSRQDQFDKAIIKLDEKVNILYMVLNGDMLTIFPKINDPNRKWYNVKGALNAFGNEDSLFVSNVFRLYLQDLDEALKTGDWSKADSSLKYIDLYQKKAGSEIVISDTKRDAEIFYNESAIFRHLFEFYFIVGLIFLILLFIKLLFERLKLKYLIWSFVGVIIVAFGFHTFGLILRWYISGHAPWSNGYESMIYISWATQLAGLIFAKRSKIALAATTVLSGMILLVAHLSWIDPEITNLVPVLQSYWLTIHVAVITASYGFLSLGALLGFINLLLMLLQSARNKTKIDLKITQLTYINEMTLIAGLFLLSIGTFLGGVWANESWGRYWGWDAKETWALITMLVYAFVLHMRFVPKLKGIYTFNLASLLSISTVIMTYFGVNYYLSGLHSYAKGDPVPIPSFVYYTLAIIAVVAILALVRKKKLEEIE
ncbi:MAG: cytochrome c biogenesis protein CcsA [Bacteroidales bacterium]|nr:cytochrome c biogenesis protein CcsA [Bacteroidales bacterium]